MHADAFLRLFAELREARHLCPDWIGRRVFALRDELLPPDYPPLPIVSDRVVLSHAGWRRWAAQYEPLASLQRANGGQPLSGRALRRDFPQARAIPSDVHISRHAPLHARTCQLHTLRSNYPYRCVATAC